CASRIATAWPIPELAPVTSTFLPANPFMKNPLLYLRRELAMFTSLSLD
ncbi:MAG: hypothetical protein ACI9G1_002398, partial [Pirellulaceae bacterium]